MHSSLLPLSHPTWKETDESELTSQTGTEQKDPTLGRALLPGDSALGNSLFLVSASVAVIFVKLEVFYSVPDDMKSK